MKKTASNILCSIFFLLISFNTSSQTPCVDGMAGDYPCMGFDLLSHLGTGVLGIDANGNDCWGWTEPSSGNEYAIMCGSNTTVFIDITDPVQPIILGHLPSENGSTLWRDAKVFNNYVFIVSELSGHGIQIFDLTRLIDIETIPMVFEPDTVFSEIGSAHNIVINEETGYAYPVGAGFFANGPIFINIQDPLNPEMEGGYDGDGYTHDAQVIIYSGPDEEHQGKEILFGFNTNSLTIVDVTDKLDPIQLSRTEYDQSTYTHQGWIDDSHSKVFMNDEIDEITFGFNTKTLIMDVSDLDDPFLSHEYFGETSSTDHNLYVNGDKLYQSNYKGGLRVLQIYDDPTNPLEEVGYFDCFPPNDQSGYDAGTWSNYPYFNSGNIIISAYEGLFIVRPSTIGTSIMEEETASFKLFPNPTNGIVRIKNAGGDPIESYLISDISGSIILSEENLRENLGSLNIDVSNLSSGTYFLFINKVGSAIKLLVE